MRSFMKFLGSFLLMFLAASMIACGGGGGGGGTTPLTEQQLTEQDAANIDITYAEGNNSSNVTGNITLSDSGDNGSDITWTSTNSAYLDADGTVNRPVFGSGNQTVTLTATLVNGSSTVTKDFVFTILEIPPTDAEAIAQAKSALEIGFSGTDNTDNVTQDIILATEGLNDTEISWLSDQTGYITNDGDVTQPAFSTGGQTVTLTATISRNGVSDTKSYILTVKTVPPTDAEAVAQVQSSLSINYQNTDSASSVTLDVGLITSGSYDTTISWETTNSSYITASGNVTRPEYLTEDQTVTLTATITKNSVQDTKDFVLTVTKLAITTSERILQDKASLKISYQNTDNESNVTQNVTLPTSGSNGTNISWITSNASYITTSGNVTRPIQPASNQTVTLTATISYGGVSDTKVFTLIVTARPLTDDEAVAQDKSSLAIGYASGNSSTYVNQNVTLAGSGSNATTITWISSDETTITTAGNVTRPAYGSSNVTVTLTATITRGSSSQTKGFTLTVIRAIGVDLSALTFNTATLSPVFSSSVTSYKAYVANNQSSVGVTSTVVDTTSWLYVEVYDPNTPVSPTSQWLTGSGVEQTVSLNVGLNHFKVRVCNDDGVNTSTKYYTILIYRSPFVDNGDGTMTDTRTSKMWIKVQSTAGMTYAGAQTYTTSNSTGGHTDWRLPTETELRGLVNGWSNMDAPWKFLRSQEFGPPVATYYWASDNGYYANTKRVIAMATDGATSGGSWVEMSTTDGRPSAWLVRN